MNLQKHFGGLSLDGHNIGSYAGFYSLGDLCTALGLVLGRRVNVSSLQNSEKFFSLCNLMFGLDLHKGCKPVSVLKESGLYITRGSKPYCDFRLIVIFYALSCDEAMVDCLKKGFGI